MTPEMLTEIRMMWRRLPEDTMSWYCGELLDHVDELTRQLEDARNMVVQSRFFQNTEAEWYEPSYPGDHMPDVGPVAWDKQVQQT